MLSEEDLSVRWILEDNQWILANVEKRMYEKAIKIDDMDLVGFDNELVEYVEIFDPLDMGFILLVSIAILH